MFSGIGGIDLAAHWAGMETVAFCEREPFPQKVLKKHWPDVPIYDDVKTLTKARLEADGIDTGTIGIISAGYPCQPESYAGKRQGEADDRWLWPEAFRIIQEIQPRWFVGENVAGHITMGLDNVLDDLESINYETQTFVIPAAAVGAFHRRDRVFIASYSKREGRKGVLHPNFEPSQKKNPGWAAASLDAHSNTVSRLEKSSGEPSLFRSDDGFPDWLDRSMIISQLQALGNAVNPYQIYPIMSAIKEIDDLIYTPS